MNCLEKLFTIREVKECKWNNMVNVPAIKSIIFPSHTVCKLSLQVKLKFKNGATEVFNGGTGFIIVFYCLRKAGAKCTTDMVTYVGFSSLSLVGDNLFFMF